MKAINLCKISLMKIKQLKIKTKNFKDFKKTEWIKIHPKHYGVELEEDYWDTKHLILEAVEGKKTVGALTGELMAGVLYIPELIIADNLRGKGIGTSLLKEAEKWVRKQGGHEVYLVTGKKWQARDFYKKLGYQVSAEMPKHYSKVDFVLLRKLLE
ncbi:GNAT family N-acetyltransferase [Patescibacteria group bacterium]